MPELPEVQTVINELAPALKGAKFWKVEVKNENTVRPDVGFLMHELPGKRIEALTRKGKYIVISLTGNLTMVVHLRMTGILSPKPIKGKTKHIRAIFTFTNAKKLYFTDMRKFGKIYLFRTDHYEAMTGMAKLGVDPIEEGISAEVLKARLASKKGTIKGKLLDQTIVAGIGNIYADEICFCAGVRPETEVQKIKNHQKLSKSIVQCLEIGIANNGTTISDFVGANGQSGRNQDYLNVYGREGEACHVCGSKIVKTRVAGRGTYYCPTCQH